MLGIIDKVDLVAISDLESPTRCGDLDYTESAVDCRDEDFLAGWLDGLVLIDKDHGEGGLIGANPLPSDIVASPCGPSNAIAGSDDLVGASRGDQGKECDEKTHVEAKRGEEQKGKGKRGRREGERYKRKERGFVEGLERVDKIHGGWAEKINKGKGYKYGITATICH